jgi:hypothetical protein
MVVNCDYLRQQHNQECTAQQIAQNLVTEYEAKIQQLQTKNQDTTVESNAYQDRITTLQNKLKNECDNTKALHTAVVVVASQPPDNNYMLNQYPFQTQRSMMAVGMNSHHLSPTYL